MLISSSSQYAWTDNMIEVPNKMIINDIFTPFIVSLNTHIKDVLITKVLIDSPLLIIKENINCGNLLNKDGFNFFTRKFNHKFLIDSSQTIIVVDKRLYGEALFSQDEIYSNTYMHRIKLDFKNLLNSTYFDRLHHDYSKTTTTQQEHKGVQRKVCSIIYTLNFKNDFLIKHFKKTLQKDIDRKFFKINFTEALQENVDFQDNFSRRNSFPKTHLQTTMSKRTS